ncbi:MAG: YcxB family protein [Flavobacteriaceae bacterium]|jgi:hypothetical protein|nr:YcxB family protein [Flavobacteriaceae bacterium]
MKIQTQISQKEYLSLTMELYFKRPLNLIFELIGILLIFCYFINRNFEKLPKTPFYYVLFGVLLVVGNPLLFYFLIKNQISKNPQLTEKITYEFSPEIIKTSGENFDEKISWENVLKITENKNWLFIHEKQKVMSFIPKSAFGERYNDFKLLIESKGL